MPASWIRVLFWCFLFVLVWAEGTFLNPADPDLWHRFALADYLLRTHHFPAGDTFSYLADYRLVADHEWGSSFIFYPLYFGIGPAAIVGLKLVTMLLTLAFTVWAGLHGRRPTVLFAAFYAVVLMALLPSFGSTLRCGAFTHFFLALWLYWFQRERHGSPVPLWFYPATMIIWANLHGGFALGLAWLLAVALVHFVLGRPWQTWLARFGLSLAATLVNPFGWHLWVSTARALVMPRADFGEWSPPSWWPAPWELPGYKLLFGITVIAILFLLGRRGWRRLDRVALLLIGGAMALSLSSARHDSLFAIITGALLPDLIPHERTLQSIEDPIRRLSYLFIRFALVLVPLFLALSIVPRGDGFRLHYPPESCPAGAVDFLRRQNVQGKLLLPFNYGSYAIWNLRGRMRVSMDGRYDLVYRAATYQRVKNFFLAKDDWTSLLTAPAPDAVLVPMNVPVFSKMETEPGWREAYHDKTDAVFLPNARPPQITGI